MARLHHDGALKGEIIKTSFGSVQTAPTVHIANFALLSGASHPMTGISPAPGKILLDFDPRGQKIDVLDGTTVVLEILFPSA